MRGLFGIGGRRNHNKNKKEGGKERANTAKSHSTFDGKIHSVKRTKCAKTRKKLLSIVLLSRPEKVRVPKTRNVSRSGDKKGNWK